MPSPRRRRSETPPAHHGKRARRSSRSMTPISHAAHLMHSTAMPAQLSIARPSETPSATRHAGARLDRLPLSSFHRRIFFLIGAGMFFDGYDLYVGTTVLGSTIQSGFSTLNQNAQFVSATFSA